MSFDLAKRVRRAAPAIAFALSLLLLWEIACLVFRVNQFALPRPSLIFATMVSRSAVLLPHIAQTTFSTLLGFALGVASGFLLGVLIGSSRLVHRMTYPSLIGFNAIPKVAFVPVLAIWFGIGTPPAVLTAMLICLFPIVVVVSTSIATVAPELNDVLRSLGARRIDVLMKVGIPQSMPYFFASLKIAITLAFIGAVTSETVAANAGVGFLMMKALSDFDIPLMFAGVMSLVLLGIVLYAASVVVETRITGWAFRGSATA
jgi:NitT/TauT family transport system permease protein